MVLKDWKRRQPEHTGEANQIIYTNRKKDEEITIEESGFPVTLGYAVTIRTIMEDKFILLKELETKSRALAFAKQYMRTH